MEKFYILAGPFTALAAPALVVGGVVPVLVTLTAGGVSTRGLFEGASLLVGSRACHATWCF